LTNNPLDSLGPGEHTEPANVSGETHTGPIPDGEMPAVEQGPDPRRRTQEMKPVSLCEHDFASEHDTHSAKHRTGTDHDGLRPVRPQDHATEQRLDRSAHDLPRENTFDSVPDDAGPHSDKI
jgi:hypothetical protein